MKLYYLFLLVMFFLMSCGRTENVTSMNKIGVSSIGYSIYECTINGHDYISHSKGITHSGTCKKCKQERDSVNNLIFQKLDSIKNENN